MTREQATEAAALIDGGGIVASVRLANGREYYAARTEIEAARWANFQIESGFAYPGSYVVTRSTT